MRCLVLVNSQGVDLVSTWRYFRKKILRVIMKFETTFNNYFGKELAKSNNPEETLNQLLDKLGKRTIELNGAREKMSVGFQQVLDALTEVYPALDKDDPNLQDTPNRMARALLEVCSGLGAVNSDAISTTFPKNTMTLFY